MNVPEELKYTKEHEWVKVDGDIATVGITDWAQGELGDVVYVDLPEVDTELKQMSTFGTIEAVKAVSEIFSPLSGEVAEINSALEDDPMVINRDPYGEGWIIKIAVRDATELEQLLSADDYKKLIS